VPKNKVVPIAEALSHVKSGMSIAVGGFIGQGDPLTLIDHLKMMDVTDLTLHENDKIVVVGSTAGVNKFEAFLSGGHK
jgi:acyl CoA:acetate/3-ketoacid CoA transferase alpha subunit